MLVEHNQTQKHVCELGLVGSHPKRSNNVGKTLERQYSWRWWLCVVSPTSSHLYDFWMSSLIFSTSCLESPNQFWRQPYSWTLVWAAGVAFLFSYTAGEDWWLGSSRLYKTLVQCFLQRHLPEYKVSCNYQALPAEILEKKNESPATLLLKCLFPCSTESRATEEGALLSKLFPVCQGEIRLELSFHPQCCLLHTWEIPVWSGSHIGLRAVNARNEPKRQASY